MPCAAGARLLCARPAPRGRRASLQLLPPWKPGRSCRSMSAWTHALCWRRWCRNWSRQDAVVCSCKTPPAQPSLTCSMLAVPPSSRHRFRVLRHAVCRCVRHCHTPPISCLLTISSSSRSLALQHARAKTRMCNAPVLAAACERGTRVCVLADVGGCVAGVLVAWGLSPSEVERVCCEAHVAPAPDFAASFSPLLHLSPVCVNLGQCLCAVCVGRIVGACMRVEACVKMCIPVYASTQFTRIRTCM